MKLKRIVALSLAFCFLFSGVNIVQAITVTEENSLVNESFNYAAGTTASTIDGFSFTGSQSATVVQETDGNKALLLTAGASAQGQLVCSFDTTTSTKVKVSYKMKWVTHTSTTVPNNFGSVRSGGTALHRTRDMYGGMICYSGSTNRSFITFTDNETAYHEITYVMDMTNDTTEMFVDGVTTGNWGFHNAGDSADSIVFDIMPGSSVYLDDIKVANLVEKESPVAMDESFNYDAGTTAASITGLSYTGGGSAVVVAETGGNKALLVSASDSAAGELVCSFDSTTSAKVKVSFKMKWVKHSAVTNTTWFGAVCNTDGFLLKARDYGTFGSHFRVGDAMQFVQFGVSLGDNETEYRTVEYLLDMNQKFGNIWIDGVQMSNYTGTAFGFETLGTYANSILFQIKAGASVYFDDIKVENVKLEVKSAEPADASENVDIDSDIKIRFSDKIAPASLTDSNFALTCGNSKVDSNAYTISEDGNGLVTIKMKNGFNYNSDYVVTVSKAVNSKQTGYLTMDNDYSFAFKTADFSNVTEYVYDFSEYDIDDVPALTNGLGWKITAPTGSSASIALDEETNSNVLRLSSLDTNRLEAKLLFPYVDGDIIEISYDFKAPNHSRNANGNGFGSVMSNDTLATLGWMYSGILTYFGNYGSPSYNQSVTTITDQWHTITQSIDLKNNKVTMYVDGSAAAGNDRVLQNSVSAVNALYFSAVKNAYLPDNGSATDGTDTNIGVYYIDNVKIKSISYPKVVDITPANGSEKVDITDDISITFDAPIDTTTLASGINVWENGTPLNETRYNITPSAASGNTVALISISDMKYSSTYKISVSGVKTSAGSILTMQGTAESEFKTKISGVNVDYTSIFFTDTITARLEAEDVYVEDGFVATMALYDKAGNLLGLSLYSSDEVADNAIDMSIPRTEDASYSKIFVWTSYNELLPLTQAELLSEPERQATIMNNICADKLADLITDTNLSKAEYEVAAEEYVAQYLKDTNIGRMLYNINYSRSCVTSDYMDSLYYNISFDENGDPKKDANGDIIREINPASTSNTILNKLRELEGNGIDIYEMAIDATHKYHTEAWLSFRMADHHSLDDATYNSKYHIELCGTGYKNYNNEKLRNNYKRYILEMVERYDVDGIELDWLRSPGIAIEKETCNQFMRDIKAGVDAIAQKRGKEIKIGVRLMPEVYQNENAGFYADEWVNEGLIDTVVAMNWYTPTNFSLDLVSWRNKIDATNVNNNDYELLGGMDYGVGCNGKNLWITPEHMKGFTSYIYNEGSDGVYMFNNCWIGYGYATVYEIDSYGNVTEKHRVADKWKAIESQESAETGLRRHLYSEPSADAFYQNKKIYPLSVSSSSSQTVVLNTGTKPQNGYYVVALGIKGDDGYATDNIKLTVNGAETQQIGDAPRSSLYPYNDGVTQMSHMTQCGERVMQFKVDLSSVNTGDNTFVISGTDANTKNIVWFEVFIDTTKNAVPVEAAK